MDPHAEGGSSRDLDRVRAALADRYRVEREIGRGGMSVVYLAIDLRHGRQVAIKTLKPELAAVLGADRFLREIEISAALHHPHILPLFDSGEADGLLYYVMPYIPGPSLRERLRQEKQLPLDAAVRIAKEVADALSYAHEQGIIHRDIKPQNILLDGEHALVADFGVARAVRSAGGEQLTGTGIALGTPAYMSPEQSTAERDLDGRTDIYSLGCVVFEMLGGTPPFGGASGQAVIARHLAEPPPSLRVVRPALPPHVDRSVSIALAKVPADRFATARKFAEALEDPGTGARAAAHQWVRRLPRRLLTAAAIAIVAVGAWRYITGGGAGLDERDVVVFPFSVTGQEPADSQLGQSVALALTWALNTTSDLRALDGWHLLSAAERAPGGSVELAQAREIARARGAGRLVTGSVLVGDSVRMMLELYDAASGRRIHRSLAADRAGDPWVLGLRGAGDLVRVLVGAEARLDEAVLAGHSPAALEQFLLGEDAYRRSRFDDAFEHYRAALRADAGFSLAGLRAAQAARWSHRERDADIEAALDGAEHLPPRYGAFARGLRAYLDAEADSAVAALEQVIALEPEWHEAWMALGEVYMHLLPDGPPPDSMAAVAFEEVRRLDPGFTPVLYHLTQVALWHGETERARRLLAELRRADADPALVEPTALLVACATGDTDIDWRAAARQRATALHDAAQWLTAGGLHFPGCAERAWRALLAYDTTGAFRFAGLLGLQSVLTARGDAAGLRALLDADTLLDAALFGDLYILSAVAGAPVTDRAAAWADSLRALASVDSTLGASRLWFLGTWEVFDGRLAAAEAILGRLRGTGEGSGIGRQRRLLAASLAARLALARGDSAEALERLRALRPTGTNAELRWFPWESLGAERLMLAELFMARGAADSALRTARVLDAAGPIPFVMYLPRSLELRIRAAERLGYQGLADELGTRLARLRRR